MASDLTIPLCILAGGQSRRFGSPKGLAMIAGMRMLDLVLANLRNQTKGEITLNAELGGPYASEGLALVPDIMTGSLGPLAGIHAAMHWGLAKGYDRIATCPLDTPFLPQDWLAKLVDAGEPALCASNGQWHPVIGLWPCALAEELEAFVTAKRPSVHSWAQHCAARVVEFPFDEQQEIDPFLNINRPNDLAQAAKRAATLAIKP